MGLKTFGICRALLPSCRNGPPLIGWFKRLTGPGLACALVAGCASGNFNQPGNQPTISAPRLADFGPQNASDFGETVIGLSFSGGGTRASAFAYGTIKELAAHEARSGGTGKPLIDDVAFVSGVSGGSVPAVYFALHGANTVPYLPR